MVFDILEETAASVLWEKQMKATGFSKILVPLYQIAWHHIWLDCNLSIQYCENLKFHRFIWFYYLSVLYSEIMSSSSLSSSESDTGIYTNDEGREGNNANCKLTNIKQPSHDFIWHDMRSFNNNSIRILSSTCQCYFEICLLNFKINLLKPTGHVMHQQFNIQQLYILPTLYLCVLYLSENKQRLVPFTA